MMTEQEKEIVERWFHENLGMGSDEYIRFTDEHERKLSIELGWFMLLSAALLATLLLHL